MRQIKAVSCQIADLEDKQTVLQQNANPGTEVTMAPLPLFLLKAGACTLLVAKTAFVARYLYKKYRQSSFAPKIPQGSNGMEQTIPAEAMRLESRDS